MSPDLEMIHQSCTQPVQAESTLTVKWGVIIVFALGSILGFFGWLAVGAMSHESRITKVETKLEIHIPEIKTALSDLKTVTKEIRDDQIRRQINEK